MTLLVLNNWAQYNQELMCPNIEDKLVQSLYAIGTVIFFCHGVNAKMYPRNLCHESCILIVSHQ